MKTRRILMFIALCVTVSLAGYGLWTFVERSTYGNAVWSDHPSPRVVLLSNLKFIAHALEEYTKANSGQLPTRLSDLVPQFVPKEKFLIFFLPVTDPRRALPRLEHHQNDQYSDVTKAQIDKSGMFVYLGERGKERGIILYEAMPYNQNSDYPFARTYVSDDFAVHFSAEKGFQEMMFTAMLRQP